jgi:hypothetical protein
LSRTEIALTLPIPARACGNLWWRVVHQLGTREEEIFSLLTYAVKNQKLPAKCSTKIPITRLIKQAPTMITEKFTIIRRPYVSQIGTSSWYDESGDERSYKLGKFKGLVKNIHIDVRGKEEKYLKLDFSSKHLLAPD